MSQAIYPCLWFNGNATDAVAHYCNIFREAAVLEPSDLVSTFILSGTKFMALNGGPKYHVNESISYYVYCGNEDEVLRLYELLSANGKTLMPPAKYAWSPLYAWVEDRYGVNWQLDIDDIRSTQKIVPTLLFANQKMGWVKSAVTQYTSIFHNSKVLIKAPYPAESAAPAGSLLFAQFRVNELILNAMSSTLHHDFDFSPGNSFVVNCQNQEEIDYYWDALGEGGHYDMCGWLTDKFGISWQIVPENLGQLLQNVENGANVMQALLKMQKIDSAKLINV